MRAGLFALGAAAAAVPYGTDTASASYSTSSATIPYSMGNTTVVYNPTGTAPGPRTSTVYLQPQTTVSDSVGSTDVVDRPQSSVEPSVATSLTCVSAPTVTVTATDRFTVTVTPGVTSAVSSTGSPAETGSTASSMLSLDLPVRSDSSVSEVGSTTISYTMPTETTTSTPVAEYTPAPSSVPEDDSDDTPNPEVDAEVPTPAPEEETDDMSEDIVYPISDDEGVSSTPVADVTPDEVSYPVSEETTPETEVKSDEESYVPSTIPSSGSGKGKRGLAYNDASLTKCFEGSSQVTWAYNWGQYRDGLSGDFEFVPTLWGTDARFTDGWEKAAEDALASGSTHLLAFNEPDHAEQANISPAVAAEGYKTYMEPFAGRARLGAPGVTNGGGNMGLTWLSEFLNACDGCTLDFIPIHWYDSADKADQFKDQVVKAHELTGKPIWVTEFGAYGADADVDAFLQEVLPWLDEQSYCERYSYFMVREGMLVNGQEMSAYGKTYASI